MSDDVTITIATDAKAANTDLDKTAASLRNVGAASNMDGVAVNINKTGAASMSASRDVQILLQTMAMAQGSAQGMAQGIGALLSRIAGSAWVAPLSMAAAAVAAWVGFVKELNKLLLEQRTLLASLKTGNVVAGIDSIATAYNNMARSAGLAADARARAEKRYDRSRDVDRNIADADIDLEKSVKLAALDPKDTYGRAMVEAEYTRRAALEQASRQARDAGISATRKENAAASNESQATDNFSRIKDLKNEFAAASKLQAESATKVGQTSDIEKGKAWAAKAAEAAEAAAKAAAEIQRLTDDNIKLLRDASDLRDDASVDRESIEVANVNARKADVVYDAAVSSAARDRDAQQIAAQLEISQKRSEADADIAALNEQTAAKKAAITVDAPRAASAAASIGGVTGGMMNNAARMADQRAAAMEAIQNEHTRLLSDIKTRLEE